MSQSDWQFTIQNQYTFLGGTSGSARQHNTLTNALTSSGNWCREFIPTSDGQYTTVGMLPINNSELTSSSGYEYGYAYSLRCWARCGQATNGVILSFKNQSDLSLNNIVQNAYYQYCTGYYLKFIGNSLYVHAAVDTRGGNNTSLDPYYVNVPYEKNYNIGNLYDKWVGLRMDVSPVTGSHDKISIYTASYTSPDTWNFIDSVDIPRTKIGAYVPWANNPNGDGVAAAGKGYMGIIAYSNGTQYPVYIDQFEVYRERIIA